jgi:hypothetical protein
MKRIVIRYRCSKYRCFTGGLLFALISGLSLLLCFSGINNHKVTGFEVVIPFFIAVFSMILGFVTMFRHNYVSKERA